MLARTPVGGFPARRLRVGRPGAGVARVIVRRIALALLLCAAAVIVSATERHAAHSSTCAGEPDSADHPASCPDPDADGTPCGPACPCTCCPGHSTGAALGVGPAVAAFELIEPETALARTETLQGPSPDDLHPEEVRHRIFHPPRG